MTCECGCGAPVSRRFARGHNARRHSAAGSLAYQSWQGAKQRTNNPRDKKWSAYGGRGITMCQRYRDDFAAFFADMGDRPMGLTLDRVDNSGGYWCGQCAECRRSGQPFNLRWATHSEQRLNQRARVASPPKPCSKSGEKCLRPHYAKGVCYMHYMREYQRRMRAAKREANR